MSVDSEQKVDAYVHFGRLSKTYGGDYKEVTHTKQPANRYRLDIVKNLVRKVGPQNIFDIGCGTGDPLIEFSWLGLDVRGFDFSKEMAIRARKNSIDVGLSSELIFQDNMEDPSHARNEGYDCLVALGSVYYVRNFEKTMARLAQLLQPEGVSSSVCAMSFFLCFQ